MKRLIIAILCLLGFGMIADCGIGLCYASQLPTVPKADIDFSVDVSTWWHQHPLNPEGPNYTPDIISPAHTVNLNPGDSIGNAINSLPAAGGTIQLASGSYLGNFDIIGKNNVHIIAPNGATINVSPSITLAGCQESVNYHDYNYCFKQQDPTCMDCWENRIENIYFKNITFDGGNSSTRAVNIKTSDGVMFDNCVFQNIVNPGSGHGGLVNGHAGCDSVWFRDCHLIGSQRWAVYLDGMYGGGMIHCIIEGNVDNGILWLCNEDFSMDADNNGTFSKEERRNTQYSVVYGSTFTGSFDSVISGTGNDLMIRNNTVNGQVNTFAHFNPKTSLINPDMRHYCYNIYVENNLIQQDLGVFAHFNTNLDYVFPDWDNKSHLGKYTVRGNRINANYGEAIRHSGIVDGPNIACGNCWNDSSCTTNDTCTDIVPDTDAPTVPETVTVTAVTGISVSLQWEPSADNYAVEGYSIYRNGQTEPIAQVSGVSFVDTGLSFDKEYTYTVSAYDAAGNESGKSSSVTATTNAPGDLDGSKLVDVSDLTLFVFDWLEQGLLETDLDFNNKVDFDDYALLVCEYWTGPDDTPPTDPTNLAIDEEGDTYVILSWDASYDALGRVFYELYRNSTYIDTTEDLTFTDTGLASETSYDYYIIAVDLADNASSPSSVVTATTLAPVNLLANPSFEGGMNDWSAWQQGSGQIEIVSAGTVAGVDAVDGDMIVKMDGNQVFQWGPQIEQHSNNFTRATQANRTYQFSAWLKLDNITSPVNQGVRLVIFEFDDQGNLVSQSGTSWGDGQGTSDWKLMEVEHTTGSNHGHLQARIDAGEIRTGHAYWDMAELFEVE